MTASETGWTGTPTSRAGSGLPSIRGTALARPVGRHGSRRSLLRSRPARFAEALAQSRGRGAQRGSPEPGARALPRSRWRPRRPHPRRREGRAGGRTCWQEAPSGKEGGHEDLGVQLVHYCEDVDRSVAAILRAAGGGRTSRSSSPDNALASRRKNSRGSGIPMIERHRGDAGEGHGPEGAGAVASFCG